MEYDTEEEKLRKRKALLDKYKEKGFIEKAKEGISEWWLDQRKRAAGEWSSKK
jgi:hypothetical protein